MSLAASFASWLLLVSFLEASPRRAIASCQDPEAAHAACRYQVLCHAASPGRGAMRDQEAHARAGPVGLTGGGGGGSEARCEFLSAFRLWPGGS